MILAVAIQDAIWFVVVEAMRRRAPSALTRKLLTAMLVYVAVEFFFHVPMESAAGSLLW